jgi:Zn-dependent peptidase ImmA (M78 family)
VFWGLNPSPIQDLVGLLESNGLFIARDDLEAPALDSFSEYVREDQTAYCVLGTEKASAVRSRFDAAHELGHVLLHRTVTDKYIRRTDMFKLLESQAHRFAGAFLLPASSFATDLMPYPCGRWRCSSPSGRSP